MNRVPIHLLILATVMLLAVVFSSHAVENGEQGASPKPNFSLVIKIRSQTGGADFTSYMEQSMKTIRHNWITSLPEAAKAGATGVVITQVQVNRDGTFLNDTLKVETSSRRHALDDAAIAAIHASAPFPYFPTDFHGRSIELRITFLYNVPPRGRNPGPDVASPR